MWTVLHGFFLKYVLHRIKVMQMTFQYCVHHMLFTLRSYGGVECDCFGHDIHLNWSIFWNGTRISVKTWRNTDLSINSDLALFRLSSRIFLWWTYGGHLSYGTSVTSYLINMHGNCFCPFPPSIIAVFNHRIYLTYVPWRIWDKIFILHILYRSCH